MTHFAVSVVCQFERKEPKVMLFRDAIAIASAVHLATQYEKSALALRERLKPLLLTLFFFFLFFFFNIGITRYACLEMQRCHCEMPFEQRQVMRKC